MDRDTTIIQALDYLLSGLAIWAFIDAALRKPEVFPATNRLTKPIWLGILGASAFVGYFLGALSIFGIAAAVGTIVYLVDVRPAVRELRSGGW